MAIKQAWEDRSLAEDHIPHIFMSGPSIWNDFEPPQHHQWWMVHLASRTDNPQVTVYMRDCCTDQFGVLEIYIGDYEQPPFWDGEQLAGTEGGGTEGGGTEGGGPPPPKAGTAGGGGRREEGAWCAGRAGPHLWNFTPTLSPTSTRSPSDLRRPLRGGQALHLPARGCTGPASG